MTFNLKRFCIHRRCSESTSRAHLGGEYSRSWSRSFYYHYAYSYSKSRRKMINSSGSASREEDYVDYSQSEPAYSS